MLFRMARLFLFACFSSVPSTECRADADCSTQSQHRAATQITSLRKQLLAIKVELDDTRISPSTSDLMQKLKAQLDQAAQAVLACHDISVTPATIQQELATLLHANLPERPDKPVTAADVEKPWTDVFGSSLEVRVTRGVNISAALKRNIQLRDCLQRR